MGRIGGVGATMMLVGLGMSQSTWAQQSVLSAAGFTGYSVTPTAHLLPWGSVALAYDNEIVGGPTGSGFQRYGTDGHNFVAGFGISKYLEISGRLASNTIHSNCFAEGCGIRDISFGFKGGAKLDSEGKWNIAIGANDFGGQVTYFRTFYGVVTYSPENFNFSTGYAKSGSAPIGGSAPLDGVFASAAYRPIPWAEAHVEYSNQKSWAGFRLFAPNWSLPDQWAASIGINTRLTGQDRSSRNWISAAISVPLYKVPTEVPREKVWLSERTASNEAITSNVAREFTPEGLSPSPALVIGKNQLTFEPGMSNQVGPFLTPQRVTDDQLFEISEDLRIKGFEDISIGRSINGAIAVKVNNATYNINTLDGLGVALGVIARRLAPYQAAYRLVLTQRQIAIVGVTGQSDCLAEWIAMRPPRCEAGRLYTPGTSNVSALVDDAAWLISSVAPSWATTRLMLQPALNSAIATEYGVFDYSVGIRATIQQPLWQGAFVEVGRVSPIDESRDYKSGKPFSAGRILSATDRILFHQVVRLPVEMLFGKDNSDLASQWGATSLTAHAAVGRINSSYKGTYGELRWEPFEGLHRIGLEGGRFERTTFYDALRPIQSRPVLGSYRYSFKSTKTDFEVSAGQFLSNDRGAQFLVTQWFDDISLSLYIRRTKFSFESQSRTFAGIEISIPLTPRKDMSPSHHVQVTGTPQWFYGVETKIGATNTISTNQGIFPGVAVLDRTFNYDRSAMSYFEENMARIRSAASK